MKLEYEHLLLAEAPGTDTHALWRPHLEPPSTFTLCRVTPPSTPFFLQTPRATLLPACWPRSTECAREPRALTSRELSLPLAPLAALRLVAALARTLRTPRRYLVARRVRVFGSGVAVGCNKRSSVPRSFHSIAPISPVLVRTALSFTQWPSIPPCNTTRARPAACCSGVVVFMISARPPSTSSAAPTSLSIPLHAASHLCAGPHGASAGR